MKMNQFVLSMIAATGLMGAATFATAQEAGQQQTPPAAQQQQAPADIDDATVDNFIAAYQDVQTIHQEYSQQLQAAEDPEQATSLQQEAQEKMQEAVTDNGLTITEYQQVANMAGQDPELRERIEGAIE